MTGAVKRKVSQQSGALDHMFRNMGKKSKALINSETTPTLPLQEVPLI